MNTKTVLLPVCLLLVLNPLYARKTLNMEEHPSRVLVQNQVVTPLNQNQRQLTMYSRRMLMPSTVTWGRKVSPNLQIFEVTTMNGATVLLGLYNTQEESVTVYDPEKGTFVKPAEHPLLKSVPEKERE